MKPTVFHLFTLLLLLCSALTLTGAVDLTSSLVAQQGIDRCCNHTPDEDLPAADPSSHCSSGDCNCVGCCLPLLTTPPRVFLVVAIESPLKGARYLHKSSCGILKRIDYPPEIG